MTRFHKGGGRIAGSTDGPRPAGTTSRMPGVVPTPSCYHLADAFGSGVSNGGKCLSVSFIPASCLVSSLVPSPFTETLPSGRL